MIRHAVQRDYPRIMEIYTEARKFMKEHGNPNQWGPTNWPPETLVCKDIQQKKSFVYENDAGLVVGVFYFEQGIDIEPTYQKITDGSWQGNSKYGVVHRIASLEKGIGTACINWAYEQCGNLRMDTHPDNIVMQNLLTKLGFEKRGIIYVVEDPYPRYAYEKL